VLLRLSNDMNRRSQKALWTDCFEMKKLILIRGTAQESSRTECAKEYHEIYPDTITELCVLCAKTAGFKECSSWKSSHVLCSHFRQAPE